MKMIKNRDFNEENRIWRQVFEFCSLDEERDTFADVCIHRCQILRDERTATIDVERHSHELRPFAQHVRLNDKSQQANTHTHTHTHI